MKRAETQKRDFLLMLGAVVDRVRRVQEAASLWQRMRMRDGRASAADFRSQRVEKSVSRVSILDTDA